MPINWNEVDRFELGYIQERAIAEADYQAYLNKRDNSFLYRLFNPLKMSKRSDYYDFSLYKNYFYYLNYQNRRAIKIGSLLSLPSELENNIMKYLNPAVLKHRIDDCGLIEEFLYVDDNEENRKRLDKVVALIEKYLDNEKAAQETRQKEAEVFIDNYINSKDTK